MKQFNKSLALLQAILYGVLSFSITSFAYPFPSSVSLENGDSVRSRPINTGEINKIHTFVIPGNRWTAAKIRLSSVSLRSWKNGGIPKNILAA